MPGMAQSCRQPGRKELEKMDKLEIKGKVNTALCYAKIVEDEAIEQIRRMCDHEFTEGSQIRIMTDVHSGRAALSEPP